MDFLLTSIGKKWLMAVTGFFLALFLLTHTAGVGSSLLGSRYFVGYAAKVHSLGPLLIFLQIGLGLLFCIHIFFGCILFLKNRAARPVSAAATCSKGGRTFGSRTMFYSGLFLLFFLFFHFSHFTFSSQDSVNKTARAVLSQLPNALLYVAAFVALGAHLSHGLWSMFQTLGANVTGRGIQVAAGVAILVALVFITVTIATLTCPVFLL